MSDMAAVEMAKQVLGKESAIFGSSSEKSTPTRLE